MQWGLGRCEPSMAGGSHGCPDNHTVRGEDTAAAGGPWLTADSPRTPGQGTQPLCALVSFSVKREDHWQSEHLVTATVITVTETFDWTLQNDKPILRAGRQSPGPQFKLS